MAERFIEVEHQDGTRTVARFFSSGSAEISAEAEAEYLDEDDLREFEADLREGYGDCQ
jgi:hypothetical protein